MTKPIKVEIPSELLQYLDNEPEKKVKMLLVFELYREKKITIRQDAEILDITYREMEELLEKNEIYRGFGREEFDEEIQYGFGSN
jgi:predicted HTH domain antitoxin